MDRHLIDKNSTILDALEKINNFSVGLAFVLFVLNEKSQVIGSLTDGDIRRGLLKGFKLDDNIEKVMNKNFHFIDNIKDFKKIKELKELDLKTVPFLTKSKEVIRFINLKNIKAILPIDAVLMAGGKGVRLKPYTNDTPKPLLVLNKKPIIAHNIDRLMSFGIKNFYISVNHLKSQIIDYLDKNYQDKDINITYIEENTPLGTIGSVKMVEKFENNDILVMNSDVLTNIDFEDFYQNYKDFNDEMSVATFNVKIDIPYAVLETQEKRIKSFVEKPTYTYYSNAGIYLLKKENVKFIPQNEKYDAIDLIENLIKNNKKVSHFPIRGYWLDIGTPANYSKAQDDIQYIKF